MRSLWGKAPFQFEVRDVPMPEPGPGEVVVRVTACGICGTDLHFLRHNADWTPLGRDVAGVVHAVGAQVTRWQVLSISGTGTNHRYGGTDNDETRPLTIANYLLSIVN